MQEKCSEVLTGTWECVTGPADENPVYNEGFYLVYVRDRGPLGGECL